MPNTSGKVLQGSSSSHIAGTTINAGLPNITGNLNSVAYSSGNLDSGGFRIGSGCFSVTDKAPHVFGFGTVSVNNAYINAQFDASKSNSIYGNSSTVQPPAVSTNFCIKY